MLPLNFANEAARTLAIVEIRSYTYHQYVSQVSSACSLSDHDQYKLFFLFSLDS